MKPSDENGRLDESRPHRVIPETPQFGLLDSDFEMDTDMEELFLSPRDCTPCGPPTPTTPRESTAPFHSPLAHHILPLMQEED